MCGLVCEGKLAEGVLRRDHAGLGGSFATCRSGCRGPEPALALLQASLRYLEALFLQFCVLLGLCAKLKISAGRLAENTKHLQLYHSFAGASGTLHLS